MLKLYNELANWWLVFSPPSEYVEEARFFRRVFLRAGLPKSATFLELGSGGRNNASLLKPLFAHATLTDLSPHMLAVSRKLNPECEHIQGDMRSVRLGRVFDIVFIHDAIEYMTSLQDLQKAIETAFIHCKKGGLAMFVPDHVQETFKAVTDHGGEDGDGRGIRWLEWVHDPDANDSTYIVEFAFLLREGDQPSRVEYDRHMFGLFPRADWLRLMKEAGFQTKIVRDQYQRDVFVARKPKG
jgi:Methyltransferase domain